MSDWLSSLTGPLALPLILGVGASSLFWLLRQTRFQPAWFGAVGVPAILSGYSVIAMAPAGSLFALSGLIGFLVSLIGGFLFDQDVPAAESRRNSWPLGLWGLAALIYTLAPAGGYFEGWQQTFENWSGASVWVGVGVLVGQALSWLLRSMGSTHPLSLSSDPRVTRVGGSIAAAIALWLLLPSAGVGFGGGTRAPANSLLVGFNALDNKPLYILDLASGNYRRLNMDGGVAHWSPDGTRMALTRKAPELMQLFVANADGSGFRQVAKTEAVIDCVWSADGQRIYFTHGKSFLQSSLSVVPAEGGAVEEVLPVSEAVSFPRISPDGSTLAYFKSTDFSKIVSPPKEIKLFDLATKTATVLLSQPSRDWDSSGLAWTPDGKALIFSAASVYNGPFQLQRLSVADQQLTDLKEPLPVRFVSFTWTSDGASLVMLAFPMRPDGTATSAEIWLVDPATGNHRQLQTNGAPSERPFTIHAAP